MSKWNPIVSGLGMAVAWYRRAADLDSPGAKEALPRLGQ
jgi:hypothetical protein